MTAHNVVGIIAQRLNIFEKKISGEICNIKNDMDSRFLSLEQRLIKIEIEHDCFFCKIKLRQRTAAKIKNEFLEFICFLLGIFIIILLIYAHVIT